MPDGGVAPPKRLPTEAQLDASLARLAQDYADSAKLSGSPLRDLLARLLSVAVAIKDRADLDALEEANWLPGLLSEWGCFLSHKHKLAPIRPSAPRAVMTVADVAALLGWGKERARRWLKGVGVPIERIGNTDYVTRREVESKAKLRLRKRGTGKTFGY